MKRIMIIGGLVLAVALASAQVWAAPHLKLASGEAEVLYDFEDPASGGYASPEGIAFDHNGNLFVSLRTLDGAGAFANRIIKITSWGERSVLADLGPAYGRLGAVGLTTDPRGNVYVAFNSSNEADHGVWKIYPDGEMEHLAGSEDILSPNALTFDRKGNLYVTDYDQFRMGTTGVWRYGKKDRVFKPWASHPLLLSGGGDPDGNPMGGANGIVFDPPNHLYVANTQRSLVARVTVKKNGTAGDVSVAAAGWPILNPDGLALDAHGNVYVVIPLSTFPQWFADMYGLPPTSPVVRIDPSSDEVQPVLAFDFPDTEYFDFPTSLAFGKGPWDKKSVFVVGIGAANYGLPFGTGPKLTQVGVGIPGK